MCGYVCVRENESERKGQIYRCRMKGRESKTVCVCMCACVYVCLRENERERERVKRLVYACVNTYMCV